eukprot:3314390-Amphidinium_carterae.1
MAVLQNLVVLVSSPETAPAHRVHRREGNQTIEGNYCKTHRKAVCLLDGETALPLGDDGAATDRHSA